MSLTTTNVRPNHIFILTTVVTLVALLAAWYYFSQDYSALSAENSRGDYIEFRISNVGFGSGNSFTMAAYLHEKNGEPLDLGPIANMGNRQMVAALVENGQWLDDGHFQARLENFQMDISQRGEDWQLHKVLEPTAKQP